MTDAEIERLRRIARDLRAVATAEAMPSAARIDLRELATEIERLAEADEFLAVPRRWRAF